MTNHPNRNWRRRLVSEAAALGPDLVSAWCALATRDGVPLIAAAAALSATTGRAYSANLLCRWRRGDAPVPEPAARVMRSDVLHHLLGAPPDAVAAVLEPPAR